MSSSRDSRGTQPRSDRQVEGDGHPAAPAGQVDVRRPARFRVVSSDTILRESALSGARAEETRLFVLWGEARGRTLVVARVADEVVSFSAVASARADQAVVAITIHSPFAQRTGEVFLENGRSEPSLDHGFEEDWLDVAVSSFRGHCVQPLAGSLHTS